MTLLPTLTLSLPTYDSLEISKLSLSLDYLTFIQSLPHKSCLILIYLNIGLPPHIKTLLHIACTTCEAMDDKQDNSTPLGGATPASSDASKPELALLSPAADQKPLKASEATMKKHKHHKKAADKKKKKGRKHVSSSDSSASSTSEEEEEADSEDETESSSDDTSEARTQKKDMHKVMKKMMRQLQKKTRRGRRTTHNYESSSSSESEASVSDDDQDHDHRSRRRNKSRRNRHRATRRDETIDSDEDYDYQDTTSAQIDNIQTLLDNLKLQATHTSGIARRSRTHGKQQTRFRDLSPLSESDRSLSPVRARGKRRKQERDSKQYKRIDEIWDSKYWTWACQNQVNILQTLSTITASLKRQNLGKTSMSNMFLQFDVHSV